MHLQSWTLLRILQFLLSPDDVLKRFQTLRNMQLQPVLIGCRLSECRHLCQTIHSDRLRGPSGCAGEFIPDRSGVLYLGKQHRSPTVGRGPSIDPIRGLVAWRSSMRLVPGRAVVFGSRVPVPGTAAKWW